MTHLPLAQIESPPPPDAARGWLLLGFGFRPFFLAASIAAVALVLAWLAALHGWLAADVAWHAHEMIFGVAAAVIAGFLLTAVPNWTGEPRIGRVALMSLVLLWLAGRIALWPALVGFAGAPGVALDLAFVPMLALTIAVPILRSRNRRNYGVPLILLTLAAAHALSHDASASRWVEALGVVAHRASVHAVVLLVVVIGGRVTPAFTRNALQGAAVVRAAGARDVVAIATAALALALAALAYAPPALVAAACSLAAAANAARMLGWASLATLREPLLWILHAGYAWIVVGFALSAAAAAAPGVVAPTAALHAFTTGAIGTYVLGMTSRVALGHTGRALVLPRAMLPAFAAVLLAGLARVAIPLLVPTAMALAWRIAGALWCIAFGLYAIVYFRILTSPRLDGRPG
jgi:uncharacterized protein involved in response to NO